MISPEEFQELIAEELIYPRGDRRADARHGILTWWVAATMGGIKKAEYSDYIPKWRSLEKPKPQTMEEAIRIAIKTTVMMGGTVN